jgi:hypothetical protein
MSPTTAQPYIESFMVPATASTPPSLGWPDGAQPPPTPINGTTTTGGIGNTSFASGTALTPSALVNGYASAPPYWQGSKITANTASLVTVIDAADNPAGMQTVTVAATANNQALFTLPGPPDVAKIQGIKRLSPATDIAPDPSNGGHNPAAGVIAIGAPTPAIASGHVLEFKYVAAFAGPIPAGVAFTIAPPKPAVTGLSTGAAWAAAYKTLFLAGVANGVPPVPAAVTAAETAMQTIIDGMMSTPVLAAAAIQAGAVAFWGVVAGASASVFPASIAAIPPPALASLAAGFTTAGASASLLPNPQPWDPTASQAAAGLFSGALYASMAGAQIIFPGPVPFPFL